MKTGRFAAKHFPLEPRATRLCVALQALDGWMAGASQRQIATALVGELRTDRDWRNPAGHLRDYVRRVIARGRVLSERGYRQFLV